MSDKKTLDQTPTDTIITPSNKPKDNETPSPSKRSLSKRGGTLEFKIRNATESPMPHLKIYITQAEKQGRTHKKNISSTAQPLK
jgi:hypothetical protein